MSLLQLVFEDYGMVESRCSAPALIAGADFFTTEVWTWRGLVTFDTVFVIDLASRRVQIVGSTPNGSYGRANTSVSIAWVPLGERHFRWALRVFVGGTVRVR